MNGLQRGKALGGAVVVLLGLAVVPNVTAAGLVTPHVAAPAVQTPHAVPAPSAEPPPEPQPSAEPVQAPSTAEPAPSPTAPSPQANPAGNAGPISDLDDGPSEEVEIECPGPECHPPSCPKSDPELDQCLTIPGTDLHLHPPFSSLSEDPRYAVCSGSQFLMLYIWPENIEEDPLSAGVYLKRLRVNGEVKNPKYPHPNAAPNWSIPPMVYEHLNALVGLWNRTCLSWVSP